MKFIQGMRVRFESNGRNYEGFFDRDFNGCEIAVSLYAGAIWDVENVDNLRPAFPEFAVGLGSEVKKVNGEVIVILETLVNGFHYKWKTSNLVSSNYCPYEEAVKRGWKVLGQEEEMVTVKISKKSAESLGIKYEE